MPGMTCRSAAKCLGASASQYTMISFHFPPIAASAAVSGQPVTGLSRPRRGRAIYVRFIFSDITRESFRPEQAFSDDGGKTWEVNWIAKFTRLSEKSGQTR
jgi:hypothetical protein